MEYERQNFRVHERTLSGGGLLNGLLKVSSTILLIAGSLTFLAVFFGHILYPKGCNLITSAIDEYENNMKSSKIYAPLEYLDSEKSFIGSFGEKMGNRNLEENKGNTVKTNIDQNLNDEDKIYDTLKAKFGLERNEIEESLRNSNFEKKNRGKFIKIMKNRTEIFEDSDLIKINFVLNHNKSIKSDLQNILEPKAINNQTFIKYFYLISDNPFNVKSYLKNSSKSNAIVHNIYIDEKKFNSNFPAITKFLKKEPLVLMSIIHRIK